jgi:serine phosphatase RsbU (regulator of sigma subunit)
MIPQNGDGYRQLFGLERLNALLLDCKSCTAGECIDKIRAAVTSFCESAPPTDDQTLIAIRCL